MVCSRNTGVCVYKNAKLLNVCYFVQEKRELLIMKTFPSQRMWCMEKGEENVTISIDTLAEAHVPKSIPQ